MVVFVVVGRLGKSLTVSKVDPFLASGKVSKVYIFRQEEGFPLEGAEYVTMPRWLIGIKPVALRRILRFLYEPFQLLLYTVKLKPDLLNGVFTLPKGLNCTLVGKMCSTPSVVSVVGGVVEITTRLPFKRIWEVLNLWMLKTCTAVTTKGNMVTDYLVKKGIPREKIFTLNGSINTDRFTCNPEVEKDVDILFVGKFSALKGPDRVLRVIKGLSDDGMDIKAAFLGDGPLFQSMQHRIAEENLQGQVALPGYIEHPAEWFQRSKCILIPSESEGLPTAMLEAMACGCVPIVSDVGNIKEAALHEVNAMVVPDYNDIKTFTSYTKELLSNDEMRSRMAANGIAVVNNRYTAEKQGDIVRRIFKFLAQMDEKWANTTREY